VAVSPRRNRWHEAIDDPLPGLRDQLVNEYGETVPPEIISRAAAQALHELADARLREFVPVFARRRARAHLRRAA